MTASFSTILFLHLLAVATPGPDFAVVTHRSMTHGRRAGIVTAAGIATGLIGHVTFALLGLATLMHAFPGIAGVAAIAGAIYLAWMAWCCVRPVRAKSAGDDADTPGRNDFLAGMLTNLLNPKVVLYFAGLFSQIDLSAWPASRSVTLGAAIVAVTFLWFTLVATAFSTERVLRLVERRRKLFDRALGLTLLVFAGLLAARAFGA